MINNNRNNSETSNLKLLAEKVLERNSNRNNSETGGDNVVSLGQFRKSCFVSPKLDEVATYNNTLKVNFRRRKEHD